VGVVAGLVVGVGVRDGAGVGVEGPPRMTVPPGCGEGKVGAGGFGFEVGTSTVSSFWQATPMPRASTAPRSRRGVFMRIVCSCVPGGRDSLDQHGVAVAVEAVARLDGDTVGLKNTFPTRESGYQEEQRGLRKVKVGDQCVHCLE